MGATDMRRVAGAEALVTRVTAQPVFPTEVHGVASQEMESRLERHAGAQGRLGEDHAQRLALAQGQPGAEQGNTLASPEHA